MDHTEIFISVFDQLLFPFLSIDLRRLASGLAEHKHTSQFAIPLSMSPASRRHGLAASFKGVFRSIQVPDHVVNFIATSDLLAKKGLTDAFLAMAKGIGAYAINIRGEQLVWEEESLWPMGYSTVLEQFFNVLLLHQRAMQDSIEQSPGASIISEYPRLLPTHQHYAFASLGAWLGGACNMQYFSYFATQPQNRDITINENYAQQIGYDAITANKMARSGMIAIPASLMMRLLQAQEETMAPISGSIPIDEINIANPPSHTFQDLASQGPPLVGFLVDRNYRITFRARQPGSQALYGASNILRDQYSDFYSGLNLSNLVRCKHYCAPIVDVQSIAEIVDIVNAIPIHDKEGVFFRGQGRLYTLGRDEQVNRLLFGDSCSLEPSLITSAARKPLYDYDALHFALKRFLEDWILGRDGCTQEQETKWQERQTSPLCEVDYALLALAQHYGLPTHGLDVTTSLEVALWFATHRFSKDADGFATYKAMEQADWPAPAEDYPVVIACQSVTRSISPSLHECHELEDFGLKALRPTRQSARFFLGGHSDHQNRLAEAIVCIFRLHPGYYSSELTFEHLFPNPDEDEAYRFMVNFSRIKAFHTLGTSAINYFHRSCGNPVPM